MNKKVQSIYNHSPIFLQNFFVSLYGLKLRQERYGRVADHYYSHLLANERCQAGEIKALQEREFLDIVRHAFTTVPFYRRWRRESGIDVSHIRSLADIDKLPIITKEQIRKDPADFCSESYLKKQHTFWLETSGTTGTPLKVLCDWDSRSRHYAFWRRLRSWYGIEPGDSRATFFGRVVVPPRQKRPPFWRYDRAGRNLLFSSFHLSDQNLSAYCRALENYNPREVIGYPSSIYLLARHLLHSGQVGIKPKCVFTTGETLFPYQRDTIERGFGCRVADQYGCTEMALFVSQCEKGEYHLHPEHGVVEISDAQNNGEGGAVCTSFVNKAMPLIRYKLGDTLCFSDKHCRCSRPFPVLAYIAGRADDSLLLPDGRRIGRLSPFFKGISGLREVQVVQREVAALDIYAVADEPGARNGIQRLIKKNFIERIGKGVRLDIHFVDRIGKERNGKFQTVISKLNGKAEI